MTALTEGRHAGEGILSEGPGHYSRENVVIASGSGVIAPMTVLGQIAMGAAAVDGAGNTGNGTLVMDETTPILPGAQAGVYKVTFTGLTQFTLFDPDGMSLGEFAIGGTEADAVTVVSELKFEVTQGATAFAIGDEFTITIAEGSGKYVPAPATAVDGSDVAVAVCIHGGDATSADLSVAALVRMAEVVGDTLTYDATVDDAGKIASKVADLAAAGIIAR